MKSFWCIFLFLAILLAACQQAPVEQLPTLAVLDTVSPTAAENAAPSATAMPTEVKPSATMEASATPLVPTLTATSVETALVPTALPTLPQATAARLSTRVAAGDFTPHITTLTPIPPGANAPIRTTPQVMADLIISEAQFQHAVDEAVAGIDLIERADIDFVPTGINVELTALGGQAFMSGRVLVLIQLTGDFATISLGDITVNAAEPPQAFLEVVNGDFFNMMISVLDTILNERVGEGHNLENLILTDDALEVFLLVPER